MQIILAQGPGCVQVFVTSQYLAIAMEYAAGGDMFEHVVRKGGLKESEARWFFQQLLVGVDYVHRMVSAPHSAGPAAGYFGLIFFPELLLYGNCKAQHSAVAVCQAPANSRSTNSSHTVSQQTVDASPQGVANRDIKLENTLLDGSPRPLLKICDFGYSKVCGLLAKPLTMVGPGIDQHSAPTGVPDLHPVPVL